MSRHTTVILKWDFNWLEMIHNGHGLNYVSSKKRPMYKVWINYFRHMWLWILFLNILLIFQDLISIFWIAKYCFSVLLKPFCSWVRQQENRAKRGYTVEGIHYTVSCWRKWWRGVTNTFCVLNTRVTYLDCQEMGHFWMIFFFPSWVWCSRAPVNFEALIWAWYCPLWSRYQCYTIFSIYAQLLFRFFMSFTGLFQMFSTFPWMRNYWG